MNWILNVKLVNIVYTLQWIESSSSLTVSNVYLVSMKLSNVHQGHHSLFFP